jgi:chemotaxis protein MotB
LTSCVTTGDYLRVKKTWVVPVVVALFSAGCLVPKHQLEEKQAEADAYARQLQTENAQKKELAKATADLQAKLDEMSKALVAARAAADAGASPADKKEAEELLSALETELQEKADQIRKLQGEKAELEKKSQTYDALVEGLKKEIDDGQVKINEARGRLSVDLIDKILFDSGKTEIKPAGQEALRKVAAILKNIHDRDILVEGHTDAAMIHGTLSSTFPTNWELSVARATTVVRFLEDAGVDPGNLGAAGFSKFRPVADNTTEAGKSQNRRIEIVLTPKVLVAK